MFVIAACGRATDPTTTPPPPPGQYVPARTFDVGAIEGVQIVDASRNRTIPYEVRYPIGAPAKQPVIVWSHGGLVRFGEHDGTDDWSELLAAAGYVVIIPSHTPEVNPTAFTPMCADNGFTVVECPIWVAQNTHRPLDISAVIDALATIEAQSPELDKLLDGSRIGVGGHSAGTTSVLSLAGATQQWVPTAGPYQHADARVSAFLAASPQGPLSAGFNSGFPDNGFQTLAGPLLSITGVGDETGEPSIARRTAFETAQPGDLFLSWDTNRKPHHDTFNRADCGGVLAERCGWYGATGLAYFDAYLRMRPEAIAWLASDQLGAISGGTVEFTRR